MDTSVKQGARAVKLRAATARELTGRGATAICATVAVVFCCSGRHDLGSGRGRVLGSHRDSSCQQRQQHLRCMSHAVLLPYPSRETTAKDRKTDKEIERDRHRERER